MSDFFLIDVVLHRFSSHLGLVAHLMHDLHVLVVRQPELGQAPDNFSKLIELLVQLFHLGH
jgi:hypothetical protein